jgi:hypothetical protein
MGQTTVERIHYGVLVARGCGGERSSRDSAGYHGREEWPRPGWGLANTALQREIE